MEKWRRLWGILQYDHYKKDRYTHAHKCACVHTHTYLHKLIYITHIQQPLYSACNLDTKVHIIDTLTKPVPKQRFGTLRGQMGLQQMREQKIPQKEVEGKSKVGIARDAKNGQVEGAWQPKGSRPKRPKTIEGQMELKTYRKTFKEHKIQHTWGANDLEAKFRIRH